MTCGPRISSSPGSLCGKSSPVATSTMRHSVSGIAGPMLPSQASEERHPRGSAQYIRSLDAGLYGPAAIGFSHPRFAARVHDTVEDLAAALRDNLASGETARPGRGVLLAVVRCEG